MTVEQIAYVILFVVFLAGITVACTSGRRAGRYRCPRCKSTMKISTQRCPCCGSAPEVTQGRIVAVAVFFAGVYFNWPKELFSVENPILALLVCSFLGAVAAWYFTSVTIALRGGIDE